MDKGDQWLCHDCYKLIRPKSDGLEIAERRDDGTIFAWAFIHKKCWPSYRMKKEKA